MRKFFTQKSNIPFGASRNDAVLKLLRIRAILAVVFCMLIAIAFLVAFLMGIATGATFMPLGHQWLSVSYQKQPYLFVFLMLINGAVSTVFCVFCYTYVRAAVKRFWHSK